MKKLLLVLTVVAMASFLLVGCLPNGNNAPVITSTPGLTATVGTEYSYTVTATDADGDTLTYSVSPSDLAIAANVITWTPTAAGTMDVIVTVTDGTDPVTQSFTITVSAAPVPPVAPVITAIPDQEVFWDGEPWTYQVVVTAGTGTISAYSLVGEPTTMTISAAGLITWTAILNQIALHEVTVRVDASDGEFDTETFVIEVKVPIPPDPLTATIWYNPTHSYVNLVTYVRGYAVAADAVPVEVTLSEALATGEYLEIRWNDGTVVGEWISLTLKTGETLVYEGTLNFDPTDGAGSTTTTWDDCELVCVEVRKNDVNICPACIPDIILQDTVKVDSVAPFLDLNITFGECTCPLGAYFTFEPNTYDTCPVLDCCGDACSGIDSWAIEDASDCPECATLIGTNCVTGTYSCGCLVYADGYDDHTGETEADETIVYELDFTFTDNVGNAIVDTWTITVDTDGVVSFDNTNAETAVETFDVQSNVSTVNIPYITCEPE